MMRPEAVPDAGLMDFSDALRQLKAGARVARLAWTGTGSWVARMESMVVPSGMVNGRTRAFVPHGDLHVGAYCVLMAADGTWQPGWVPSQGDLFAEDWTIVP